MDRLTGPAVLTVTTWSMEICDDLERNVAAHCDAMQLAASWGSNLVVFPEVSLHGYPDLSSGEGRPERLRRFHQLAQPVPDGWAVVAVVAEAQRLGIHAVFGVVEDGGSPGVLYNTAVLCGPEGYVGRYRKVHIGLEEQLLWQPGGEWPVFTTEIGALGIMICYDKAWPEAARELTFGGAEVLIVPSAWGLRPHEDTPDTAVTAEQYELYDRARAAENFRWVVSSNFAGTLGRDRYFGRSAIVSPTGVLVATTGDTEVRRAATATIDVRTGILDSYLIADGIRLSRDRRPETYGRSRERF